MNFRSIIGKGNRKGGFRGAVRWLLVMGAGLAGAGLVALISWSAGPQISISILYVLPIGLTTWFAGWRCGLVVAAAAAVMWFMQDHGTAYHHPLIPYWNAFVRFGFFVITATLLHRIRSLTRNQETMIAERTAALLAEVEWRRASEARLTMLAQALESTTDLISITDLEHRFTFVNRAFREAFGYTEAEILGETPTMLYSPNNRPSLREEVLTESRRGGWQGEVMDKRKDGTEFPISLSTSQILDQDHRVIGLIGISRDITARKRAEKQKAVFAGLAHRLSAIIDATEAAEIIMEMSSELFGWDAGYLHLYSRAEDRIVPILTVDTVDGRRMPVPDSSFTLEPSPLMRRIMEDGPQLVLRQSATPPAVPLVPFGNTARPSASMMYVPIRANNEVIGVLSIQSYTPQAYSPDDLTLLQMLADHCGNALLRIKFAAAERALASIVENSGDAISSKTLDGTILSWNKGAKRLYGYTAEEVKGRSVSILVPPGREDDMPAIAARTAGGEHVENFETVRCRKDGTLVEVSLNVSPTRDDRGQINGVSVIARDITERKRLEREIAEISDHEQRRIAHDLHDHLGAYLSGVAFRAKALAERLSRREVPETEDARHLVELLNEGTNQVRNYARLLAPVEGDSGGLAAGLARLGVEMETLFGVTCLVETPRDMPALTDKQSLQLYFIAQEAARNALRHGKARLINIQVEAQEQPGVLKLTVRNDGQPWDPLEETSRGLGLRIMRYRAGTLDGTLTFPPARQGREVTCQIPISKRCS